MKMNFEVASPPSYEAYVRNGSEEKSMEVTPNINGEMILPLSYTHCPQDNDIAQCLSPNQNSHDLPSQKMESTSNLVSLFMHDQIRYANNDDHVLLNLSNNESSVNSSSCYNGTTLTNLREYDSDFKHSGSFINHTSDVNKDYRPNLLSYHTNSWFLASCDSDDEKPRDYSSNSEPISLINKREEARELVHFKTRKPDLIGEKRENFYEERRKLAKILLDTSGSERKRTLKENFWIIEDEPLEVSVSDQIEQVKYSLEDVVKPLLGRRETPRKLVCHICGKILNGRSSLRTHIFLHLKSKPYKCQYCGSRFSQSSTLKNHIRRHTGEKPYACHLCGRCFTTLSIMRKHLIKHSNARDLKCPECSRMFKSKVVLQTHLKVHTKTQHTCQVCEQTFETRKALSAHAQKKHRQEKKYLCVICKKGYAASRLLKQHMDVHSNQRKHVCYVCGESYVWKSGLSAHLRTHSFKIQCEKCGEKFISLKKLEKHRIRHYEPLPHKCSKCEKRFKFSYLLKKHVAKHKTELLCQHCGMSYYAKTHLKKHLKIHTQNKLHSVTC